MNHIHITRCEITKYRTTAFRCHTKYIGKSTQNTQFSTTIFSTGFDSLSPPARVIPFGETESSSVRKNNSESSRYWNCKDLHRHHYLHGNLPNEYDLSNPVTILRYNSPIIRTFYDNIPHYQIIAVLSIYHIVSGAGIMFPIGTI